MGTQTETEELANLAEKSWVMWVIKEYRQSSFTDENGMGFCKFYWLELTDVKQISNEELLYITRPCFRKILVSFINVINLLQRMYLFFDVLRSSHAFRINNVLLTSAKVVNYIPTVIRNFIPFTIEIPNRSFLFTRF